MQHIDDLNFISPKKRGDNLFDLVKKLNHEFFELQNLDYKLEHPTIFQDGSLLTQVFYNVEGINYVLAFSKFGRLFTIYIEDGSVSGSCVPDVWSPSLTGKLIAYFSQIGYIYLDFAFSVQNMYQGEHVAYKNLTIFERYFSEVWYFSNRD